jgi:hypothetical protein
MYSLEHSCARRWEDVDGKSVEFAGLFVAFFPCDPGLVLRFSLPAVKIYKRRTAITKQRQQ